MPDVPDHAPLAGLHVRVTDDENLRDALQRVGVTSCHFVPGVDAASVTLIERGRPVTVSSTSDPAAVIDRAQYDADDGPCLAAARSGHIQHVDDVRTDDRWPRFRLAALDHGMLSTLSIPLQLDERIRGGLNLYSSDVHGFHDDDRHLAVGFADQASVVIANAHAYWAAFEATQNLNIALESRAVIEQAKGVLITDHGLTDDEAFDELRRRSQVANLKLRDVATDLVNRARQRPRR